MHAPRITTTLLFAAWLVMLTACGTPRDDQHSEDDSAAAFMGEQGSEKRDGHSSPGFSAIAQVQPAEPILLLGEGERRGDLVITLHNRSDGPWRIADVESHCRLCRITALSSQEAAAGETISITVAAHTARLERLPSRRFIRVVLVQPDSSNHEGWIPITINRETQP